MIVTVRINSKTKKNAAQATAPHPRLGNGFACSWALTPPMKVGNNQSRNKPIRISAMLVRTKFSPHFVTFCVAVSSRGVVVLRLGSVRVTLPATTPAGIVTSFAWVYFKFPAMLANGSNVKPGLTLGAEMEDCGMNMVGGGP